jgi:hypothetical protein
MDTPEASVAVWVWLLWFVGALVYKFGWQVTVTWCILSMGGSGSSVGIATDYGLNGLGIESWWRWDFLYTGHSMSSEPVKKTIPSRILFILGRLEVLREVWKAANFHNCICCTFSLIV